MTKPVWRKIDNRSVFMNKGHEKSRFTGGSVRIQLKGCGHSVRRKLSQGLPEKIRCRECEQARDGHGTTRLKHGDGPWINISWDHETQLPVYTPEQTK